MYNLAIRKCTSPSPEVENFQMKIYYPAGDRTPDLLNQKETCYLEETKIIWTYVSLALSILQEK